MTTFLFSNSNYGHSSSFFFFFFFFFFFYKIYILKAVKRHESYRMPLHHTVGTPFTPSQTDIPMADTL